MRVSSAVEETDLGPNTVEASLAAESAEELPQFTKVGGIALAQPSGSPGESREEQRRLRRLFVTARSLLQVAEEAEDERELVMTVVQAAAIWHDVDARAYRRDLQGRFVLDVRLPGADLSVGPRDFSAFSVVSGPVTRIYVGRRTGTAGLERPGRRIGAAADCRKRAGATAMGPGDPDRNRLDGLVEPAAALRAARLVPRSHGGDGAIRN